MEPFSQALAADVIKIGLQAGVIKLRGSINNVTAKDAEADATVDAAYLRKLMELLRTATPAS